MSKLLSSLAIAVTICTTNSPLQAQVNSPVKPNPPKPDPATTIPGNSKERATPTNLDLFGKLVIAFYQHQQIRTKSNTTFDITAPGTKLQITTSNETIAETGGKFRSELSFNSPQSTSIKYTIISNGKTVWIYRPDLKRYSQTSLAKFNRDLWWIGVSSVFFSLTPELARLKLTKEVNSSFVVKMLTGSESQNVAMEKIASGDRELNCFSLKHITLGFTLKSIVDPKNSKLSQLEIAGKYQGMDMMLKEAIVERDTIPVGSKLNFTFVPPKDVKKVSTIKIMPFG